MECSRCRTPNRGERRFCAGCGEALSRACPTCAFANQVGERFCGGCGAPVPEPSAAPAAVGERRWVTVLFADVVGFTALSEQLDPEVVHTIMEGCLVVLTREVERHGGRVNSFTGDGVMALFGAPLAEEDHAIRALHAALRIQEAMCDYGNTVEARVGVPFSMRIGVNTGLVVAGAIGDHHGVEYTALGDTINLAARLEGAAPPGGVLVGQATQRAARDSFEWRPAGPLVLKGRSEAVPAYELAGATGAGRRFDALVQRELTSFVGRREELAQLVDCWTRAVHGEGQVVSIVGEAGLGKSRLLHEFKGELARRGAVCHEGSCFTYGDVVSYLPFLEIVRGVLELNVGNSALSPYLVRLLGADTDDEMAETQSAAALRLRTLEALRDFLLAEAATAPMALIVEDVHWIDKASEEVLSAVVEAMAAVPLLVVLVYRPEYLHTWSDKAYHAEISLGRLGGASSAAMVSAILGKSYAASVALARLSADDSRAMVRQLLDVATIPPELEELIETHTDGNPLFIEELTRDLVETNALVREGGGYRFTLDPDTLVLPTTVQDVLLARIDRLNPELRTVLQVASVLGRVFGHELLGAVVRLDTGLDDALLQLEDLDLVHPTTLGPDRQYSFKHVLAQEAVYQTLVRARREAFHERAGQAIETLYPDRLVEFSELLAHHYGRSGNDDKAVEYLERASQKAARANAMEEAKRHFETAMGLLDGMADTQANRHRRISLLETQFLVFWMLYQLPEYFELVSRYAPLADGIDDQGLKGRLYKHIGHCQWIFGDIEESLDTLTAAAATCEEGGDQLGAAMAHALLEWGHLTLGNYEQVVAWESKALRGFEDDFDPHHYMWARASAALAYSQRGWWKQAVEECREGLRVGAEHDDDSVTCFSAFVLCEAYTSHGDAERALEYGELAVRTAPTPADKVWSQTYLAGAWCRFGSPEQAMEVLAGLVPLYEATRFPYGQLFNGVYLGEAQWRAGRTEDAFATLRAASDLAHRTGMRFYLGSAQRLLGEVVAQAGPPHWARAAHHFEQSIAVLGAIGAENELARAYAGFARLRRDGDAERLATQAEAIFGRLGTIVEPDLLAPGPYAFG